MATNKTGERRLSLRIFQLICWCGVPRSSRPLEPRNSPGPPQQPSHEGVTKDVVQTLKETTLTKTENPPYQQVDEPCDDNPTDDSDQGVTTSTLSTPAKQTPTPVVRAYTVNNEMKKFNEEEDAFEDWRLPANYQMISLESEVMEAIKPSLVIMDNFWSDFYSKPAMTHFPTP